MRVGRVCAYVTRERDGVKELLVFDHRDHPEAATQVPAGGIHQGETPEEAVLRELREEAGLERTEIVRDLGAEALVHHASTCFELALREDVPDTWEHTVGGSGEDEGLVFVYRWESVRPDLALWARREPFDPVLKLL